MSTQTNAQAPVDVLAIPLPPLTAEQVATAFWRLDSVEQADFFTALERMAGVNLCFQMAWVVHELSERSEHGDFGGLNGFRTMFYHAEGYPEAAAEWRAGKAKAALARVSGEQS